MGNQGEGTFCLRDLAQLIAGRAVAVADASYTRTLLDAGPKRIARKFGEEAVELVIAAVEGDKGSVLAEAADVAYHLLVLLHGAGLSLAEVEAELARRTRQSGHEEKASRGKGS